MGSPIPVTCPRCGVKRKVASDRLTDLCVSCKDNRPAPNAEWVLKALCRNHPHPDRWYQEATDHDSWYALGVCAGCPVINECLEHALHHNERHGVWGGLTAPQRRQLRKRQKHDMP